MQNWFVTKCLNIDRDTKPETISKHILTIFEKLESIRVLFNANYSRLSKTNQIAADAFFSDLREKTILVCDRKGIEVSVPISIQEPITFEYKPIANLVPQPSVRTTTKPATMPQTLIEFLNTASRLIPEFDGASENLQSFIDAINLVDSIKESHESVAVNLVKTKLKGTARNLISAESSLEQIIQKLKSSVKGESVDVINAKLMSIRQTGKNVNSYAKEMEELTKKLETAYIRDNLPHEIASKYATRSAVTAIIKNSTNERVKLIMESATFNNMNEVLTKFISSCTESYGQENSILTYGDRRQGYNNRNQNRNQNRNSSNRNNNFHANRNNNGSYRNYNNGNNRNNHNNNNGSYRNNNGNRNRNSNDYQNRNINLATENNSGNGQAPLNTQ